MREEHLNETILWTVLAGASLVFVVGSTRLDSGAVADVVTFLSAAVVMITALHQLATQKRATVAVAATIGAVIVVWSVTPFEDAGTWLDLQLLIGPLLLGVLGSRYWRRTAVLTALGLVALAAAQITWGDARPGDVIIRLGVLAVVGPGMIAVAALADAGRLSAYAERSALVDASGAAMIHVSYARVLEEFGHLRAKGVVDLRAHLEGDDEEALRLINTIDLRSFNAAALALYGLTEDEDLHDSALLPPEVTAIITNELVAVWTGVTSLEHDYVIPLRSGVRRWLRQTWNVSMRDGAYDYANVVITTVDVTDVKQAEAALAAEIRAKDEFIASVSHELRTPLSAVVGLASELRDRGEGFESHEVRELVKLVADQSLEVSHIVEDLLVAARLDSKTLSIAPESIDLESLISDVDPDVPCEISGPAVAWADPVRVRQVLRNLVLNAERYGGTRRWIRVSSEPVMATIEVRDDGPAVPESFRDQMFEPYRSSGGQRGLPGSVGLGLTVSRRLAELMGGSLSYTHDGEAVFELRLPTDSTH